MYNDNDKILYELANELHAQNFLIGNALVKVDKLEMDPTEFVDYVRKVLQSNKARECYKLAYLIKLL